MSGSCRWPGECLVHAVPRRSTDLRAARQLRDVHVMWCGAVCGMRVCVGGVHANVGAAQSVLALNGKLVVPVLHLVAPSFVCACVLSMSLASAQLACLACLASSLVCALALAPDFRMCLSRRVPPACLSAHDSAVRVVLTFCLLYLSCLSPLMHVCIFVVGQRFGALSMLRRVGMSIHVWLSM